MPEPDAVDPNQKHAGDLVDLAQKLCEQGRFIESKRRYVEFELAILSQQTDKMQAVIASLHTFLNETRNGFDRNASQLAGICEHISEISNRLGAPQISAEGSNVRHMSEYLADQTETHTETHTDAHEQSDASPSTISLRVLCQQARYIVVYLNRAIEHRDSTCLPRLAEDLERISSVLPSQKIKAICNEFVTAAAREHWSSIHLLHRALEEELNNITEGPERPVGLPTAC